MSTCTPGTCPHDRGVFIWLPGGPWLGNPADPDHGRYPWVHDTSNSPGHLEVCDLKPFATVEEAGEACADCSHGSCRHERVTGPLACGEVRDRGQCADCTCPRMRYAAPPPARPANADEDRLMRGESVPGMPGACSREGCAHAATRHRAPGACKKGACGSCRCPGWTDEPGSPMPPEPDAQLDLFGGEADVRPSRRRQGPRRYTAETVPVSGGLL